MLRVLHIEDEELIQVAIRNTLEEKGFHVTNASNLMEGIQQAQRNRFDVVLLDLDTGDSVGLDTLLTFHERFPTIPIVVLTGIHPDVGMTALRLGADDFLVKDKVDADELNDVLRFAYTRSIRHVEAKRRFINEASHHIATPLTPIKLQLQAIREVLKEHPATYSNLDAIERNLARLQADIDQFVHAIDEEDGGNQDPTTGTE